MTDSVRAAQCQLLPPLPPLSSSHQVASGGVITRKDSDWPSSRWLRLQPEKRAKLLRQVQHDARFLSACRIMVRESLSRASDGR